MIDLHKVTQSMSAASTTDVPTVSVVELRKILGSEPAGFITGFFGGSRVIVDPPPTDTDCVVCLLVRSVKEFMTALSITWDSLHEDAYDGANSTFTTARRGEYNLLVFEDPTEFGACLGMTALAKADNVQEKDERYRRFSIARSPWRYR